MKLALISLLTLICLAGAAYADVVTLKNGDRITGTLVTIKGGTLQLKSDILGDLSIPMAKVATYSVDKPVAVIIKGQEPVQGTLELTPSGDWQVKANGQTQTIAAAKADTIMPAATYQSLIVAAPKPWQAWKGGLPAWARASSTVISRPTHSRPPSMRCASDPTHPFSRNTRAPTLAW